jgi:hypothetical protein
LSSTVTPTMDLLEQGVAQTTKVNLMESSVVQDMLLDIMLALKAEQELDAVWREHDQSK